MIISKVFNDNCVQCIRSNVFNEDYNLVEMSIQINKILFGVTVNLLHFI